MTPDQFTITELQLPVGDGHELYVQEWGNPAAETTLLFLHGGPGSSCKDRHKEMFDPNQHRVVFFDQRGTGRSTPYGSLEANTTKHLISDISTIADKLGTKQLVLVGGSWGSTLALAYALEHPKRVQAMVLFGLFTGSKSEIDNLEEGRFRAFFPDVWEEFENSVPAKHRKNPAAYHKERLFGEDPEASFDASLALCQLEVSLLRLDDRISPIDKTTYDPLPIKIEQHYTRSLCFMPDRYILDNASKLTMPIWFIQGRYDIICPPVTAYELHKKISSSKLLWTQAGHSSNDRANYEAIKAVISTF